MCRKTVRVRTRDKAENSPVRNKLCTKVIYLTWREAFTCGLFSDPLQILTVSGGLPQKHPSVVTVDIF